MDSRPRTLILTTFSSSDALENSHIGKEDEYYSYIKGKEPEQRAQPKVKGLVVYIGEEGKKPSQQESARVLV